MKKVFQLVAAVVAIPIVFGLESILILFYGKEGVDGD